MAKVGVIKPTVGSSSLGDLEKILPKDIELEEEYMAFQYRSKDEFANCMPAYSQKVDILAAKGCEIIHPEGAPPFMLAGIEEETRLINEWEKKHKVPVFTTGTTQVAALKACGVKQFVGYTPFTGELSEAFRVYFKKAGFEPMGMENLADDMPALYRMNGKELGERMIRDFRKMPGKPQALYILGSGWRALDAIDELEKALDVPVLHPVVVRCWYILRMLGRSAPIRGHGRLLATMPPLP